jgi:hypothetical protein
VPLKQKNLTRSIGFLACAFFVFFGLKWLMYWQYTEHSCAGRALQIHWKSARFCVDANEALYWKLDAAALLGVPGLIGWCILYGLVNGHIQA